MNFTETNYIPEVLAMIDFEKAFEKLGNLYKIRLNIWISTHSSVTRFKICNVMLWSVCPRYAFYQTFLKFGQGYRQGDPISPYIFFLLCAEMSIKIKINEDIT